MIEKVFAATSDIGQYLDQSPGGNPWRDIQNINTLVPGLLNAALVIAFAIFVFLLIFAGIQWITAGGDKTKIEGAQKKLTGAIIGIIIVISAWAILGLVRNFFHLDGGNGNGSPPPDNANCLDVCRQSPCHGYDSFCFQNCRCICNHRGEMWYYENPWCDADGSQYECQNSQRVQIRETCP